jgi:hypothetical protein
VSQASFDSGATVYDPENPEALMGFDPAIVTSRAVTGSMDPLMSVTDTIARVQAFKAGTAQTVAAGLGTVAGNRFGIVVPSGQYTGLTPNNRNDLMAETLPFAANGIDSSLFLTCF